MRRWRGRMRTRKPPRPPAAGEHPLAVSSLKNAPRRGAAAATPARRGSKAQRRFLVAVLAAAACVTGYILWSGTQAAVLPGKSRLKLADIPFDGAQAYEYLKQVCELGPRPAGSEAMRAQQDLLMRHFEALGGQVERQEFTVPHPQTNGKADLCNLVVHWHPERQERILLSAHYDTRPYPDRDPRRPRGTFIGANDGASGTALLMELGRHMPNLDGRYGVDFVLFDAEELVYVEGDKYFLGSEHFAMELLRRPPDYKYRFAFVLDMVADADLQIYQERTNLTWKDSRPLLESVWQTAKKLKIKEFIPRGKYELRDDHLALHDIAGIPTCELIDFDYGPPRSGYWHTEADTPDKCSALSLAKVGWVLLDWLQGMQRKSK